MHTLPELAKAMNDYEQARPRKPSTDLRNQNISIFSNPSSFSILNKTKYLFVSNRLENNEEDPSRASRSQHPTEQLQEGKSKQQGSDKPQEQVKQSEHEEEQEQEQEQEEDKSQHQQSRQREEDQQPIVQENSRVKVDVPNLQLTESKVHNKSWESPDRHGKIGGSHNHESKEKMKESMVRSRVERQSIKKNIEEITKEIKEKVREWSRQQKEIERRKELNQEKEKIKTYEIELEKEREKIERRRKDKEEKKLKIVQRINEMQENRMKRELYLKKNSLPHLPAQQLHEKRHSQKDIRPAFKVNFKAKEEVVQEEEKLRRRKNFNDKVRSIPVSINEEKRVQLEIEKDKSKNSLKYQLLNRRGFSDHEIYERSKKFSLPKSTKQIGDQYLEEVRFKNKGKHLEIANSRSVEQIWSVDEKHLEDGKPKQEKKHILYNNDLDVLLYYKAKKKQHERKAQ